MARPSYDTLADEADSNFLARIAEGRLAAGAWEDVSPILQRRRKPDGSFEMRLKPQTGREPAVTPAPEASLGDVAMEFAAGLPSRIAEAQAGVVTGPASLARLIGKEAGRHLAVPRAAPSPLDAYLPSERLPGRNPPRSLGGEDAPAPDADMFAMPEAVSRDVEANREALLQKAIAAGLPPLVAARLDSEQLSVAITAQVAMDPAATLGAGGITKPFGRATAEAALETAGQRTLRKAMGNEGAGEIAAQRTSRRAAEAAAPTVEEVAHSTRADRIIQALGGEGPLPSIGRRVEPSADLRAAFPDAVIDSKEFGTELTWPGVERRAAPREAASPQLVEPESLIAPPAEPFGPPPARTTSIKNAVTTEERAARSLPEVEVVMRRELGDPLLDRAKALISEDPKYGSRLAETVAEKPRPLTAEEGAVLGIDRMRLQTEHKATLDAIEEAQKAGDGLAEVQGKVRLAELERAYDANDQAARLSGYEWGISGRARQMLIREDYSAARLLQRAKVAAGEEVAPKLRGKLTEIAKRVDGLQGEIAAHGERIAQLQADMQVRSIQRDVAYQVRKTGRAATLQDLAVEFDDLSRAFGKKAATPRTGLDPELVALIGKMAKNRVQAGYTKLEDVVDHIYQAVRPHVEGLTARDVRDAISGYGRESQQSRSDLVRQLAEIRSQGKLVSALEDAEAGRIAGRAARKPPPPVVAQMRERLRQVVRENGLDEGARLDTLKRRLETKQADLERRIASGDFSGAPRRPPPALDRDGMHLQAKVERLKKAADQEIKRLEMADRTRWEKSLEIALKVRRGVILSGSATIGKLGTYSAVKTFVLRPIEEIVGGALTHTPIVGQFMKRAPIEGGFSAKAIGRSWAKFMTEGVMKDAPQVLRAGESELDLLFGKHGVSVTPEWLEIFGRVHGAIKAPAKRAAFEFALEKQAIYYQKLGLDITDPALQAIATSRAYEHAQAAILMQDNVATGMYRAMTRYLREKGYHGTAATADFFFPISKVPPNYIGEFADYAAGLPKAGRRMVSAAIQGMEKLPPEDFDIIARQLKKGSVGGLVYALGWYGYKKVGGYYRPGEEREEGAPHYGEVQLFGHDIPHNLLHFPVLEMMNVAATARQIAEKYEPEEEGRLGEQSRAVGKGLLEQIPFYSEPASIVRAVEGKSGREAQMYGGRVARGVFIPPDVQRAARAFDPEEETGSGTKTLQILGLKHIDATKRYPRNLLPQELMLGLPWLRQRVPQDKEE